ncbi:MAG: hypothetical protein A2Z97_10910 [Bdellovibrionales bacterium GWB1_52_6]|nr:MAG: hypothetical protein A2Z97_10910 [Bdellovibrionales bacterium GWB1_52_6]OFZ03531.1 MAG: hypothetical protein A2X97_06180 [Bdellovibrionales bacterium GWA1_52_35]HCM41117.1 hypothetical protein [Bdellovibrionales bacterium]
MRTFAKFLLRYAGWVAVLGTISGFVGAYYSVQLYKNLRTDIEELLPTTARSVLDLDEVTRRLESIDSLAVLMFSQQPEQSKKFVVDLAQRLHQYPKTVISSVEYKIDRELRFFREHSALYLELPDLIRVRDYVRDKIEYEKELYNPLNIFSEVEIPEPKLDFLVLRQKYESKTASYSKLPDGFYARPDGTLRTLLAYMPGKSSSIDQVRKLKQAVQESIIALNPKSYAPDLEIKYTGGVQDTLEEHESLMEDLEISTVIVMLIVTAAMILFFQNFWATMALVLSLFVGAFWTFGISFFAVGYLNANSAFMGSIVIGNGINFGIIYLARFLEERRHGRNAIRANLVAITQTATATWTAALAAGLAYGSLILTGFRGFRQFGVIGLIGMVLCWISAFTLLPAYIHLLERRICLVPKARQRQLRAYFANATARFVERFPGVIVSVSLLITVASVATFSKFTPEIIETNLSKLRNKTSMTSGSGYLSKYLDEIFQRYLAPVVILPQKREEAVKIAGALKTLKAKEGKGSMIAAVQTLDDFIPKEQDRKIAVLKEIRTLLPKKLVQRLSESDRRLVNQFLTAGSLQKIDETDLPPLIISKFTERDKSVGKLVLVEPPLDDSVWQGERLIPFITKLRETSDSVAPGTPVAGTLPITSDMIQSISRDGPRATLFALCAVVLLVIVLFRKATTVLLILSALLLGATWLAGLILGLDWKINFLNFIALPITFGIGVDYGVNIFQRFRQEGGASILRVIRNTGGAVGLCSFTTITGYTSLLIAGNQGFVSFGRLAVAGELTCVVSAVFTLPALLLLLSRWRNKTKPPEITGSLAVK